MPLKDATVTCAVDVGTGSARCGLFEADGRLLGEGSHPIGEWTPEPGHSEQRTDDIWPAVCRAVRAAAEAAPTGTAERVGGLAFDATCSLVLSGADGQGLAVSREPGTGRDVVVWRCARAAGEAEEINGSRAESVRASLETVGGKVSPEMQIPKLLWLKRHAPDSWRKLHQGGAAYDLADWLVAKATGSLPGGAVQPVPRSLCTVVCKWGYQATGPERGWNRACLDSLGFEDELPDAVIGHAAVPPGAAAAVLAPEAAEELGLPLDGITVAIGAIDAHAGGIGCIGAVQPADPAVGAAGERRFRRQCQKERCVLVAGTSCCHMISSAQPQFVPGVWGPYYSAMLPGQFLTEGGQSAAGSMLDCLIDRHAAGHALRAQAGDRPACELLHARLARLAAARGLIDSAELGPADQEPTDAVLARLAPLAADRHIDPDWAGNRSPLADPTRRGCELGLGMLPPLASGEWLELALDDLAVSYLAGCQALAHSSRQIVEAVAAAGREPAVQQLVACGGLAKNKLYLRSHADALGLSVALPSEPEAVLLGTAVLAAAAAGIHPGGVEGAMAAMTSVGAVLEPTADPEIRRYHEKKYAVFQKLKQTQSEIATIMAE